MTVSPETTLGEMCQSVEGGGEPRGLAVQEIAIKASWPRWLAVSAARWNAANKKRKQDNSEDSIA